MKLGLVLIFTLLACPAAMAAAECSQDQILVNKFSAQIQAAQASGDACQMTKVLIEVLEATRAALPKCAVGGVLQQSEQQIDAQLAQDRQSYADQGCSD